jgi:hypothetical protein
MTKKNASQISVMPWLMDIHGHSFGIGGAVKLLVAGVPPEVVAAAGLWWASLACLIMMLKTFWRKFANILKVYALMI